MAAKEIYDYVSAVAADYTATELTLIAQGEIREESLENVVIHLGDDGSEERVSLSTTPVFFITFRYNVLTESDAGTVLDMYHTNVNGMAKSFYFTLNDGHTYTVRFDTNLARVGQSKSRYGIPDIRLKVLGRKP